MPDAGQNLGEQVSGCVEVRAVVEAPHEQHGRRRRELSSRAMAATSTPFGTSRTRPGAMPSRWSNSGFETAQRSTDAPDRTPLIAPDEWKLSAGNKPQGPQTQRTGHGADPALLHVVAVEHRHRSVLSRHETERPELIDHHDIRGVAGNPLGHETARSVRGEVGSVKRSGRRGVPEETPNTGAPAQRDREQCDVFAERRKVWLHIGWVVVRRHDTQKVHPPVSASRLAKQMKRADPCAVPERERRLVGQEQCRG